MWAVWTARSHLRPVAGRRLYGAFLASTVQGAFQNGWRHHGHSHSHGHAHGGRGFESGLSDENLRQCKLVTAVGFGTNVFFSVSKVFLGTTGGSVALLADGFHALTDLLSDSVSYLSLVATQLKFPRCRFPFGVGRVETTGAVVVATILLLGGIGLLLQSLRHLASDVGLLGSGSPTAEAGEDAGAEVAAVRDHHAHTHGGHHDHSHEGVLSHVGHSHFSVTERGANGQKVVVWTMVGVSIASIVCKELLFRWSRRVGERARSRVVVANAYHHRADAWSACVALFGVAGQSLGIPGVDGAAGLLVSYSICSIGYSVLRDSILEFFDFQRADDVLEVRSALQQLKDPHAGLINVFLTRHGQAYVIHATLLLPETATAVYIANTTNRLTDLAKQTVTVSDTFVTVCVYDDANEDALKQVLKLLQDFHGFSTLSYNWQLKCIRIPDAHGELCLADLRVVAERFGCTLLFPSSADPMPSHDAEAGMGGPADSEEAAAAGESCGSRGK